ncbi:BLUF domain-containing protein [Methylobacterium sp. SI9]|uniref:BLUF domain-containing protein n=1 Tax=Methylobacterium guangdongense TaxID=3138811 RepID=UPI00313B84BE
MTDLYRLIYASKNLLRGPEAEMTAEVRQILAASQRNNAAVGVTGALMFNAGAFAQVLEGPRAGVEATFERIQRDLRHSDVTVLQCGPAESRGFGNWSMAFVGQSAGGQARFSGLAAESGFDLSRLDGDRVFSMLHGLVMEEEGIPAAAIAPPVAATHTVAGTRTVAALDVVQVRAEIAQLRPDAAASAPMPAPAPTPAPAPAALAPNRASQRDATEAALHVLKAALASERARTTELRAEIDALRIALASAEDRIGAERDARDLWAGRARLLAQAMVQEADGLDAAPAAEPDQPATRDSVAA